ncbi:hypothetical protein A9Q86_07265 [Flavobacteriales bacterium 33_180_T64]|nr:hypothetical protein A9Q86_07265 [Flavobacteriales bacterium 33_180_T64]
MKTKSICNSLIKRYVLFFLCLGLFSYSASAQHYENQNSIIGGTVIITPPYSPSEVPNASPEGSVLSLEYLGYDFNTNIPFPGDLSIDQDTGVITISNFQVVALHYFKVINYTNPEITFTVNVFNAPVMGEYSDATITEGGNVTVVPNMLPQNITSASAVSDNFSGNLLVDPNTGDVMIANAKQSGIYTVTVFGFDESESATLNRSFQLTINASNECSTSFNELTRSGPEITNKNAIIGDFNNDNIQDIANVAFISGEARVQILLGDGIGGFDSTGTQPSFFDPALPEGYLENLHDITTADFDSDGNLDIAVGAYDNVFIHFGSGSGSITSIKRIILPSGFDNITSLEAGNFNNDGIIDIAVGYHNILDDTASVKIYYGANGVGEYNGFNLGNFFLSSIPLVRTDVRIKSLISGNFNDDSIDELFVVYDPYLTTSGVDEGRETSEALQVNANGDLESFIALNSFGVQAIASGNIDGQGTFDVAALTRNGIEIFLNGNVNNLNPNQFIPLEDAYNNIQIINKNGDGFLDLIISSTEADKITVLLGDGTGGFVEDISIGVQDPSALTIGDFNGDNNQDCLVNNMGNSILLAVNNSVYLNSSDNGIETELGSNRLKYITVQNLGDTDLVIDRESLTVSGPDAALFTIIGHSDQGQFSTVFPFNLGVSQPPKYIVVLFEPETTGEFSAFLNISKGDCDNPVTSVEMIESCVSTFTGIMGNYQDTTIISGENVNITSSGGVFDFARITATTDTNFDGILSVGPTGQLTVTNAIKAGTYTVKVTGFVESDEVTFDPDEGFGSETSLFPLASTTFNLIVEDPNCSSGAFEIVSTIDETDADISDLTALAIGDFNFDGIQDLITTYSNSNLPSYDQILGDPSLLLDELYSSFISFGNGSAGFSDAGQNRLMVGLDPRNIYVDDYNGDGFHDIVAVNSNLQTNVFARTGFGLSLFAPPILNPQDFSMGNVIVPTVPLGQSYSKSTAFGDFNNDGIKDLAIVSEGVIIPFSNQATPSIVSIQLGSALEAGSLDNNFTQSGFHIVGNGSVSIVVGDFNSDGLQDFATASAYDNKISIRLGKSNENSDLVDILGLSFDTGVDVFVGMRPSSMVIGDFNGDGKQDFAVACRGESLPDGITYINNGFVSIRLGNGNGGFSSSNNNEVEVGLNPSSIKVGDFNGDGIQDFAVTNTYSNDVSIRFGNGDGSFYGTTQFEVGEAPVKLVVGDFNEDNIQDLAVANKNTVSILQGIPFGDQEFALSGNGISIENNDTTPSLEDHTDFEYVAFNANSISRTFSIENSGESALTLGEEAISIDGVDSDLFSLSGISYPIFIASGESISFNVDFEPTFEGEKTAIVTVTNVNCINTTDYSFTIKATVVPPPVLGNYPDIELAFGNNSIILPDAAPINTLQTIAYTDSNFKGTLLVDPISGELSVTNASQPGLYTITVQAFTLGNISTTTSFSLTINDSERCLTLFNTIEDAPFSETGIAPTAITIGDFNNDGIQDIINVNTNSDFLTLKFGDGSNGFSANTTIPVTLNTVALAVNDINGDGFLDIVAVNTTNSEVYAILGNGDGTFQTIIVTAVGVDPGSIALGDLNNDGFVDMLLSNELDSTVYTFLGDGAGNFESDTVQIISTAPKEVILGDFNSDENLDMATANYDTNSVAIRLGNGDGSFAAATTITVGQGPSSLTIGEFNGDGIQDIATANLESLTILIGDDTGGFTIASEVTTSGTAAIKVGEFNGDGIQDLIVKPYLSTAITIYTGDGAGVFTNYYVSNIGSNISSLAIGDFNSDGITDTALTSVNPQFITLLIGSGPEINLKGNDITIEEGEAVTSFENNTNFGRVQTGESVVKTFTIENNGNASLIILNDAISFIGNDADLFNVINMTPSTSILPNEVFSFEVQFSPDSEGMKETTLHVLNNDCNTSDYSFAIEGEGAAFSMPNYTNQGAYSVISGNNISIMPDSNNVPINVVSAIASVDYSGSVASPHFEGSFVVDPETGIINVINAKPEGVYTVNVRGLQNLSTAAEDTKTFTLTVTSPECSDAAFREIQNELNGGRGNAIAEGDFNEDGITDIVSILTSNFSEAINGVNINLGNPDGTFQNPQFVTVGSNGLEGVSVSDFNGDGHQDLLTRAIGKLYLNLGAGDGSFGTSLDFSISSQFRSHEVGDFNNDGKQDIILKYSGTLTCLTGNGDGTFVAITSSHSFSNPVELKAGDFDKDGNLDFIVLEDHGGIDVYRGYGNGLFHHNSANNIDIDGLSAYYAMGDFNNDTILDIAVSSQDYTQEAEIGSFKIYFGDGNANYNAGPSIAADYSEIGALNVGDFNGDSNQDILVNYKDVILGEGDGTFPVIPVISSPSFIREYQAVIGDFNKDGKQDYVSVQNDFEVLLGAGRIDVFSANVTAGNVYLNDGETIASEQSNTVFETCINSTIAKTYTIENRSSNILTITAINLTGDNTGSFVLDELDNFPTNVSANGSTTFTISFLPTTTNVVMATLHIENNDCSDQDFDFVIEGQGIAPQSESSVGAYSAASTVSGGNITVQPDVPASGAALNTRAYTDSSFKGLLRVNPDTGEVMVTNAYPAGTYQITIEASGICTSATTTFQLIVDNPACSSATFENVPVFEYDSNEYNKELYVADFNEDGIQDLVISNADNPNNKMRIQLGNGDGTFNLHNEIILEGPRFNSAYHSIAIGDYNGDGHQDMVTTSNRRLAMYLGDGTGGFSLGDVIVLENLIGSIAIAEDFNNDGKLDVLIKEENTTTDETKLAVFLGNGVDGFSLKRDIFIDAMQVSVGDFNHDGNKDLVIVSIDDDKLSVLSGDGLAGFTETTTLIIDNPTALVLSDFNNDGEQDIAVSAYDFIPNPDTSSPITNIIANQRILVFNGSSNGIFPSTPLSVMQLIDDPSLFDYAWKLVSGDFNADGNQDMVVSYFNSSNSLPILLGDGAGGFVVSSNNINQTSIGSLAVGDFNTDGRQDIAYSQFFSYQSTSILFGSGSKVAVHGNANTIVDGSTTPLVLNDTDFGNTCPTGTIVKTFTINNKGFSELILDADAITISGGDSDLFEIGNITLPISIAANESATFTVTFTPDALGVATTTVHIATNDCSAATYSFDIKASAISEETVPPVIECPVVEMVYYTNSNSCYATIPLNVTATDNCSLEPAITSNTPLNNQFPIGETIVTYTATDDNGNTANCEVIINVVDNITPSIECIESVTIAYGESLEPENTGSPTVSDNCSIAITIYSDVSFQGTDGCSLVNYSINRFWTTTDTSGNTNTCLQVINVVDASGPIVITQDITVQLDETGNATITPDEINNGSHDACGITFLELDITSFDTSNIGENTVELTVTDSEGNVSIGYAIVTIVSYTLGIEESIRDLNVLVYPNPTTNIVNLKIPDFNQENLTYQLYSLHGQLLKKGALKESVTTIPMDRYEIGVYLLQIVENNKTIKSFKIVKK